MGRKKGKKNSTKERRPKLSPSHRPANKTLEEWQIDLRKQAADTGLFGVIPMPNVHGCYRVMSPTTDREYKVVYRGDTSKWNYCSCMDFRTSQLGTCKHIEAVSRWIEVGHHRTYCQPPAYTSVYLSYAGEREIRLRIGDDHAEEFRQLAEPYFTRKGKLKKGAEKILPEFLEKAMELDNTFRIYPDAMEYLTESRDTEMRNTMAKAIKDSDLDALLKTRLYPYQKEGILFAYRAGRAIIADEMGLGKTIQAIGAAELMQRHGLIASVLIICPTSLKYQWKNEIEKFTNSTVHVVEGTHLKRKQQYKNEAFYKVVSYHALCNDIKIMKGLDGFDMVIYDEVQRLKNWNTQLARAARRIKSDYTLALSGTPLENKLEELYSVMQLVDQYRLGPLYKFMNSSIVTDEGGKVVGYRNLNEIGRMVAPVLIRRTKAQVALQLPERIDQLILVPMTKEQMGIHNEFKSSLAQIIQKWRRFHFLSETDRRRMLLLMAQMRMVCDSTYILDQKSRHDTKIDEIVNIVTNTVESGDEKIVIFSQWERMCRIIASELDKLGIEYEYLHGAVPSQKRKELTENFTTLPESRVFISTDAGSTGLNLQVASIIINVDQPWNPAVLEQRIGRIYRIGQKRNIQVINLVARDTIEERMLSTLKFKSGLFQGILDNGEDTIFLEGTKLEKIMEVVNGFATDVDESIPENTGTSMISEEVEDFIETLEDERLEDFESDIDEDDDFSSWDAELPGYDDIYDDYYDPYDNEEDEASEEEYTSEPKHTDTSPTPEKQSPDYNGERHNQNRHNTEDHQKQSDGSDRRKFEGTGSADNPEKLVAEGISFLSGLSKTLKSPEATKKLVDTIVKVDPDTGQASINIPIPDKDTVSSIFSLLGKFLK